MNSEPERLTALLNDWGAGDQDAGNELIEIVYRELRRLAAHYLQQERRDHTLQPTALVHELYAKLFSSEQMEWRNRGHFWAVVARQLRHIIVDYARRQHAEKRGGLLGSISFDEAQGAGVVLDHRILELDLALERLQGLDARAARVVELRFFGGLTESEVGEALEISPATVKRDWEFARSWLLHQLQ